MENNQITINQRVKILVDTFDKGNKLAFSRRVGMSNQALGEIIGEKQNNPSYPNLLKMLEALPEIRVEWLMIGQGEMLKGQQSKTTDLTSGEATVERATELASNGLLREIIDTQKETITDLRGTVEFLKAELGKSGGSLEAALYGNHPTAPQGAVSVERY